MALLLLRMVSGYPRHCEERSDAAIPIKREIASSLRVLAMTE
jgi:hypothetical protein